jgi:hypothetical protein
MTDESRPKVEALELNRETVQDLTEGEAEHAQGGGGANTGQLCGFGGGGTGQLCGAVTGQVCGGGGGGTGQLCGFGGGTLQCGGFGGGGATAQHCEKNPPK